MLNGLLTQQIRAACVILDNMRALLVAFRDLKVLHFPSECHLSVSISVCVHVHVHVRVRVPPWRLKRLFCPAAGRPIHHVEQERRPEM